MSDVSNRPMTDAEAVEVMTRCKHEILQLRREIERLSPKAQAYDDIAAILRLLPRPSQGMGEDLAWMLERRIDSLRPKNPA